MLTIRWFEGSDGGESLFEASTVEFGNDKILRAWKPGSPPTLGCELNHGQAYVMNENGKTVANYILGKILEQPITSEKSLSMKLQQKGKS